MLRIMALLLALSVCLSAFSAQAAKVKGTVVVKKAFRESLSNQKGKKISIKRGYWMEPNTQKQIALPRVDRSRDLGVVLMREGKSKKTADKMVTVKVGAGEMEKNVIVVRPGTTIRFEHESPFSHMLYSPGHDRFPPEKQAGKQFRPIEFAKEGVFEIRCKLIPHFIGWVVVTNATEVLNVSRNGSFELEELEPGEYLIKVFHGGKWVHQQAWEVPKKKEVAVTVTIKGKGENETSASKTKDDASKPADTAEKGEAQKEDKK